MYFQWFSRTLSTTMMLVAASVGTAHAQASPSLAADPALSPRNASYSIEVTLDTQRRLLTGREVLTWRNITSTTTPDLRLHLYYNAWKNTRSTWLREQALAGRARDVARRTDEDWGWTAITAVRQLGAGAAPPIDLTSGLHAIAPDDGNTFDETLISVPLSSPAEPGTTINLEIEWNAQIPRTFARTGAVGNFYFIAQWFPKVGVLTDAGWKAHQFHATTEFFSDFGVYDVRMRVPTGWVLGATGIEQSRRDNGDGTTTHHYRQTDVHDFAWTTSPDYLERRARFEHATLPSVDMRLLLQPEHEGQAPRYFAATEAALRYYGEWYGPYPYGHVTVIDPAWRSGAGGMEYPTLFTGGTRWIAPSLVAEPELVTIHEAGHQFWYGMVANNEFEHAWMDEGLNQFSHARTLAAGGFPDYYSERYFGGFIPWVFRDIPLSRETSENGLDGYRPAAETDPEVKPSYQYWPVNGTAITYLKTALWLNTLERYLGWPTLQRIMSTFFSRWKFRHPEPADFFRVANEVSGRDLTSFFDEVYRGSNAFDYGVDHLSSHEAAVRGFMSEEGTTRFVDREDSPEAFETIVVVRRYGEALFPVDVVVTFEDGSTVKETWDGRDRWKAYSYTRPTRAASAQVDPERVLLLDINYTNNSKSLEPKAAAAATKWSLTWMVWLQDLILTYAFFV